VTHGFGIIGTGTIADVHADAVSLVPDARLLAVTDTDAVAARAFAGARGCAAEPSVDALLARPDIDVVCVCVPSGLHAEIGVRAAKAGRHLVVEKPVDVSLEAADRLLAAAREAGVALTVMSQHRFDPGVIELKRLIGEGALGRLVLGEAHTKWHRTQAYYDRAHWRGTRTLDGGSLLNQGVHYVDLLRWCMGPVAEVTAVCTTQAHDVEVEDTALAVVRFASGAVGTISSTTAAFPGFPQRLEITGTEGTVIIEDGRIVRTALAGERAAASRAGPDQPRPGAEETPGTAAADPGALDAAFHAAQIAGFLRAIDEGREPAVTGESGRDALEIVCAVYESSRTGQPVKLSLLRSARDRDPERVRRRDFVRPEGTAGRAGGRVHHLPGTAQRLVGERRRLHR
jgi:predicted dehydrogenase